MLLFGLMLLCTGALAQIPSLGSCPNLKVVQEFDVQKVSFHYYVKTVKVLKFLYKHLLIETKISI